MNRHTAHETVASAPTAETLPDQAIERILRIAFAPHRCDVKFQIDAFVGSKKVAVIIYSSRAGTNAGGRPFIVEGVDVDALRQPDRLLTYIDDLRKELQRRHVALRRTCSTFTLLAQRWPVISLRCPRSNRAETG